MINSFFKFICKYTGFSFLQKLFVKNFYCVRNVNQLKREVRIVVSISCAEENFDNFEYTLYSIFNQSVSPDNVVLWISNQYELSELPYSITKFVKNGLDIRFVDDKDSYTKIIYALKEFRDCIIVIADDNIFYPRNWLSKLYHSYITNPDDIHVHSALIAADKKGSLCPYKEWRKHALSKSASYKNFPVCECGVLYPPNCFVKDVLREDIYKNKANTGWEIWSWVMSVVSGRKIRVVMNNIKHFQTTNLINSYKKYSKLIKNSMLTDEQLRILYEYYGKNLCHKLAEK